MTMTWSVLASSSDRAEATTRLFTLVRRSTSLDRPPEEEFRAVLHHGLVSPRLRAMSRAREARSAAPAGFAPGSQSPWRGVAATPLGLCTWRISSRMGTFSGRSPGRAGLPNQEVMVPPHTAAGWPRGLQPLHQAVVDLRADGRALPLFQAPDQVLVVIHL